MSTQMQLRGGTTAETLLFTGAQREVSVDTDKNTVVVHDGVTPGGFTVASEAQVADSTYFYLDNTGGGSAANAYILVPQANTNQPNSYMNGIVLGFVTANANTGASTANFQGLGVKNIKYPGGVDPAAGDIFGRVTVVYDSGNDWLELQRKPATPITQIRALTAAVASNALTVTLNATTIGFRSSVLGNGLVNTRVLTSAISIVAPSGASLGSSNGAQSTIAVIAIDNAGTVELALVNLAGTNNLDESGLINTTTIGAGSVGANTFYSTVGRTSVPYRVVGYVQSTQPTAGVWSTTPSKVQGQGGQTIIQPDLNFGTSQTWQDVTGSRVLGTTYTNATSKAIVVSGYVNNTSGGRISMTVGGVVLSNFAAASGVPPMPFFAIVPPGATYVLTLTTGTGTLAAWAEMR